jgi:excisionase family DNA binding protein
MKDPAWWKFRLAVLGVRDAAAEAGVSAEYVRRLIRQGRIRAVRVGNSWAIEAANWEAFKRQPRRPGRPAKKTSRGGGHWTYDSKR